MELTYTAIRHLCIPPTAVISAPGFLVGSGMGTPLRGFLHAEPGARLHKMARSQWSAHVEVPTTGEHFSVTYLGKSVAS